MSEDIKFVEGFYVDPPREGAPDFVKGRVSIKASQFCQFMKKLADADELSNGYINIDVLESKGGKWYAKINDFKPDSSKAQAPQPATTAPPLDFDDDIGF